MAEAELWEVIEDLHMHGQSRFAPKDLLLRFNTKSSSWVSKALARFVATGKLRKFSSMYEYVSQEIS
jgi:hypothetical protein